MCNKLKDTASEFEKLEAIKKLCDELTAENARLLIELDKAKVNYPTTIRDSWFSCSNFMKKILTRLQHML